MTAPTPRPARPVLRWLLPVFGVLTLGSLIAAFATVSVNPSVTAAAATPAPAASPAEARPPAQMQAQMQAQTRAQAGIPPSRTLNLRVSASEPLLSGGRIQAASLRRDFALKLSQGDLEALAVPTGPLPLALRQAYRRIEARTPGDARFTQNGAGVWTARAQTGWTVNRQLTAQRLRAALADGEATATAQAEVQVALTLTPPARTVQKLQAAGVLRHVGSGVSSFAGSPDFRVHNIRVGSSKLSGLLLEPGEVFDFNRLIGRISSGQGFVPGYVISGSTLRLEDGGGICQVSTTVFRAAYSSGLQIVERHAHSHQVAYYDPPGFEATVYAPNLNLRFRNDTAGGLLVQASWDLKAQTLRFDLFGSRRREVTVSAPRLSDLTPARPPAFMPDPALEPGQALRVDMPAQGMNIQITRQVKGDDGQLRTDQTRSRYRPWGGVFAVHPGDERLKP